MTFCFISRCLESEEITPILKQLIIESSLPLKSVEENFAVDSTGFRTKGYSTWFSTKYERDIDKAEWIKVHLMCGTLTSIVTAVGVSSRKDHDSPFFHPLLTQTAQSGFNMREVSADNVESVFSTIKRKFGEKLRSKTETAQVNEALCKVLAHNLCCVIQSMYELGIEPTFASEITVDANVT